MKTAYESMGHGEAHTGLMNTFRERADILVKSTIYLSFFFHPTRHSKKYQIISVQHQNPHRPQSRLPGIFRMVRGDDGSDSSSGRLPQVDAQPHPERLDGMWRVCAMVHVHFGEYECE
jgi:hypothetical protein